MKKYRISRGRKALDVPNLPSKKDFEKSYFTRCGSGLFTSFRLGHVNKDILWENLSQIYQSKSISDRQWCIRVLNWFGFFD